MSQDPPVQPPTQPPFSQRIDAVLEDQALQTNLRQAMDFLVNKRQAHFLQRPDFEALQQQGRDIRQDSLDHLADKLETLEKNCLANGIQVHWAEDAAEACQIIAEILQSQGARSLVKGKSMASEEIELNTHLAGLGIDAIETDMGEYIVQLDESTPSHIIMPAIHKTREQIAQLFHERLGKPYTDDVDALIGIGREVLRERFMQADAGLSGVNFAIADEGAICLVENEGNGRMSTTVPPLHIALCGIEKVLSSLQELPPLLELLTKSATGQAITTYINLIRGPRQADELDGPEQVHLVLLDNGRSTMYQDEALQETLRCIRCGACMNHCPVYTRLGGHAYGSTYPGPIGQVVTPQQKGLKQAGDLVQACSLNGACQDVCPVGIPLPSLIRQLRQDAVEQQPQSPSRSRDFPWQRSSQRRLLESLAWQIWAFVYRSPARYRWISWCLSRLRKVLPLGIGPWAKTRSRPQPAARSLHEILAAQKRRQEESHE